MLHPIQRLHAHPESDRIYTATSNVLHVFSASTGALLSTWTAPVSNIQHPNPPPAPASETSTPAPEAAPESAASSPVAPSSKRQKLDPSAETTEVAESESFHSKLSKITRTNKWSSTIGGSNNAITKLATTDDGKHLIVATSEDKSIRVFSTEGGKLELLSTRALPKRVADFSPLNNDTILAGDKHGDVFSLPLHPSPDFVVPTPSEPVIPHAQIPNDIREASAAEKRKRTEIDYALPFEHNFVLGHVSMLLRVLPITVPQQPGWKGDRTWIVTADRDEHIRVTRWPDSFVIDRFLLKHESFVSSILCPSWGKRWLLSGGGDEYVLAWDWQKGECKQKLALREVLEAVEGVIEVAQKGLKLQREGEEKEGDKEAKIDEEFKIVVNGIWEVPGRGVVIGVEKVPLLLHYAAEGEGEDEKWVLKDTIRLDGNILDVTTVSQEEGKILVSVDGGSELVSGWKWDAEHGKWVKEASQVAESVQKAVEGVTVPEDMVPVIRRNVLYTVGILRKEFREGDVRNAAAKAARAAAAAATNGEGADEDVMEE